MSKTYRVKSFVPSTATIQGRIFYVEEKTPFGWRDVPNARGMSAEAAMESLKRLREEPPETVEFQF
jgi:hypothetical protein